jgi:predicted hydrolase (HD superfamily)
MNIARETLMAKTLFACDELCGFVIACAMVHPNKLRDLQASSVKKKLKDKAFARTVSREDIQQGIAEMHIDPDVHIQFVIDALASVSAELGLE